MNHSVAEAREPIARPRVLLAEDDDDTRSVIAMVLRYNGYDVIEVATGADFLDYVGETLLFCERGPPPDIIVADIRLPGFTGTGILAGLRGANVDIPFITMTAYGGPETAKEVEALGANALFLKPFDIDAFIDVVKRLAPAEAQWGG